MRADARRCGQMRADAGRCGQMRADGTCGGATRVAKGRAGVAIPESTRARDVRIADGLELVHALLLRDVIKEAEEV